MHRLLYASVPLFYSLGGLGQTPPNIRTLFDQLNKPTTTNAAAQKIRELAGQDSTTRDFIAQRLPSMIGKWPTGSTRQLPTIIWMNAVRLAGQLKVTRAIPALIQALLRRSIVGGYDYGVSDNYPSPSEGAKLRYDIVGRALADIGDPSVPAIADILSRGDVSMRKRAFFILANITSPVAEQAMRDHLPNESEPTIRKMIQQELHLPE